MEDPEGKRTVGGPAPAEEFRQIYRDMEGLDAFAQLLRSAQLLELLYRELHLATPPPTPSEILAEIRGIYGHRKP